MRSDKGEAEYKALTTQDFVEVKPLYFSFLRIADLCTDEDSPAKLYAKQLILHAMDYQERVNPKRGRSPNSPKIGTNDEAIVLSTAFSGLEAALKQNPDGREVEMALLSPDDISAKLSQDSLSLFWPSLQATLQKHPKYLNDSEWFYDMGKKVETAVIDISRAPQPKVKISPMNEKKFSNGVFFQLRTEMRRIQQVLEEFNK